ncbi:MAG: [FeFe] hydrogenase H-cluster radical SAM maturase HydE [Negativicutes bacterium]|nr:[FeFe] hydrogenase H-cluster radical SAM maturase HydE [Negativicutes bacterium]
MNLGTESPAGLKSLLLTSDQSLRNALLSAARSTSLKQFGNSIYIRGLIEFTNFCKNDCYYCGIRCSNRNASRYRLTKEQILSCCEKGHQLGFRTFVLQGGEDPFFTDSLMIDIISSIKKTYPDSAITLSIGEKSYESYKAMFDAGADRYLLRHETANPGHYALLHPAKLSLANRLECLKMLREIGYQVGTGFMVGSPFQTIDNIIEDLLFIKEFKPHMIGIGPFIPHHDTPFHDKNAGTLEQTLRLIAILRLMLPKALIPATTALGTIAPDGREQGVLAGANVVMPNLSPIEVRENYSLYDNKLCTNEESAEGLTQLQERMHQIGYKIVVDRGDYKD